MRINPDSRNLFINEVLFIPAQDGAAFAIAFPAINSKTGSDTSATRNPRRFHSGKRFNASARIVVRNFFKVGVLGIGDVRKFTVEFLALFPRPQPSMSMTGIK